MLPRFFSLFTIDPRSLALFRVSLGLMLLWDLFDRSFAMAVHYAHSGTGLSWSLHSLSPNLYWQIFLFVVAALAALSLTLGFKIRAATAVSFLLLTSLHHHNHYLVFGADSILRLLLFWSIFLPFEKKQPILSPASIGILIQVAVIFIFSGSYKISEPLWLSGEAVDRALAYCPGVLGLYLRNFEGLTKILTYVTLASQLLLPILAFVPRLRLWITLYFILMEILMALFMDLTIFPFACIVAWILFLPESFWIRLGFNSKGETKSAPINLKIMSLGLLLALFIPLGARFNQKEDSFFVTFGLNQIWKMFAPPPTHSQWSRILIRDKKGVETDYFTGKAFDPNEKYYLEGEWARPRWGSVLRFLPSDPALTLDLAGMICKTKSESVASLQIFSFTQEITPVGKPEAAFEKQELLNFECLR